MEEKKTLVERIKELVFTEDVVEQDFVDVKTSEGLVLRVALLITYLKMV